MKKTVRKSSKEIKNTNNCTCSRGHKIWAAVALAGLFTCGLFLGLSYNGSNENNRVALGVEECDAIAQEIINITKMGATSETVETLRELNEAYSNGCAGRLVIIEKETVEPKTTEHPEIIATCSRIEQLLKERLNPETSTDFYAHLYNAETYSTLAEKGCSENADMYKSLALREIEIATALRPEETMEENSVEVVIDTYKKLDMQKEAQVFLDKIEKLTDPAIDFILKMEKIINE